MGWKGTLRSINAETNRQARLSEKRERDQQKQERYVSACNVVAQQEEFLEMLVSLHEVCNADMDWDYIRREAMPVEPSVVNRRTTSAQRRVNEYNPNFIDKTLRLEEWKRRRLNRKLDCAKEEDRKEYESLFNEYQNNKNIWNKRQSFATRLKNGDSKAYIDIIKEYGDLSDLPLGESIEFTVNDKNDLVFDLTVSSQEEIIPDEEYSLRQSGILSSKKRSKTKSIDIYQDHVCSCLLRVSREVFGLLPVSTVQANVWLNTLNSQTGHMEDQIIVSAIMKRATMETMNFKRIDPSDSLRNFVHNMKFTKSKGFDPVQKIELD